MEAEDEFRALLHSVNQMAENIENLNANMEQLVAETDQRLGTGESSV